MIKSTSRTLPLVSVIIPTYNRCNLLKQTIDSVLNQTYPNIELILVDDGSTDNTYMIAKSYKDKIKYIKQKNLGGTIARNTGISAASGEYLNFLDHDDLFLPQKIEKQVMLLEAKPKIGFVHCRYYFIDENGKRLAKVFILPKKNIYKRLIGGCFIWSGGPLIRKKCIDKVGPFDNSVWSSDWDMWLNIISNGYKLACVQETLGEYRILHDSTMLNVERTELEDINILDKVFNKPNLPNQITIYRNEAYARWRLWLSCRYFAVGSDKKGKENLQNALDLYPELAKDKEKFIRRICDEALDFRVRDPLDFINRIFNNLPQNAQIILQNKELILSNILLRLSFRNFGNKDILKAKGFIIDSFELNPLFYSEGYDFIWNLFVYSIRSPLKPIDFINLVFDNLPDKLKYLEKFKKNVLSQISMASIYEKLEIKKYKNVQKDLIRVFRNSPSWKIMLKTWLYYS
jgi:glycosyltransferase involved in cell wall biosynthesis